MKTSTTENNFRGGSWQRITEGWLVWSGKLRNAVEWTNFKDVTVWIDLSVWKTAALNIKIGKS